MPKYLVQANYVGEGVKGLLKDGGSNRKEAVQTLINSMGGSLECMYYAFGETDLYVIADMPDNPSMAATALMVGSSGAVAIKTTVLMTPEEIDEASKKTPIYSAPGHK